MNEKVKISARHSVGQWTRPRGIENSAGVFADRRKSRVTPYSAQEKRDGERGERERASSPLRHRLSSRHRDDDGAAPRRAASRRHRRRVYMQLSVRETSRRTPPAGHKLPFDFPRSFRATNRVAPLHTAQRSVPVPRVSVSPPVSLYFPPRRSVVRVWHGVHLTYTRARAPSDFRESFCARARTQARWYLVSGSTTRTRRRHRRRRRNGDGTDARQRKKSRRSVDAERRGDRAIHKWLRRGARARARACAGVGACANERRNACVRVCMRDDDETSHRDAGRAATRRSRENRSAVRSAGPHLETFSAKCGLSRKISEKSLCRGNSYAGSACFDLEAHLDDLSPFRSHKYFRREPSAVFHSNNLDVEGTIGRCNRSYVGLILLSFNAIKLLSTMFNIMFNIKILDISSWSNSYTSHEGVW